jgi:plastocyanin
MTYMLMNHRAVPDKALIQYKVTVETDPLTAVQPWWLDIRDCHADPIYNVAGRRKASKKRSESKGSKSKKAKPGPVTDVQRRDYTFPAAGRIVAGAGHVHGGANNLSLSKPDCGDATIATSTPTWGNADHPFYNVRPILHEPGPINMSAFKTPTGIPVAAGERIRLNSSYDNRAPHVRVMGIFPVYVAPDPSVTQACGGPPGDVQTLATDQPGRSGPIPFRIPLTGLNSQGQAVTIKKPPGKLKEVESGTKTLARDRFFNRPNLKVEQGDVLKWQFTGSLHNLTLANGPLGIGTDNYRNGEIVRQKLTRPGTYRFFCSLHPVQMTQRVVVSRKKKDD